MIANWGGLKKKSLRIQLLPESALDGQNSQNAFPYMQALHAGASEHVTTLILAGIHSPLGEVVVDKVQQVNQEIVAPLLEEAVGFYQLAKVESEPWRNKLEEQLLRIDIYWQNFIQHHVDTRLGGSLRSQQLAALDIQMSEPERDINRRLLLAIGNLGLAWGATHLFVPLSVVNIAFSTWLAWRPLYKRGYQQLVQQRRLTFPVVVFGSSVAAYAGGYFIPASIGTLVMITIEKVLLHTEDHYRRTFVGAFGTQPLTVWVVVDGVETEVPFASIRQGDMIVLEAGQMIPVDGVVNEGIATVDQHILTGESQPVEKIAGDRVLAATLVLAGKLYVRVEKTGAETNAAKIAAILQNAAKYKLGFASRVQSFNDSLVLPMLAIGGLGWLTLGTWAGAAVMGMGVGAMARVAGPLAMLSYMKIASQENILVKDVRALEVFRRVDTIVFDKTGTLTLEQPEVFAIHVCGNLEETILLRYAAAAEAKQTHPIAEAILAAAAARGLSIPIIEESSYIAGFGIKVQLEQQTVRVGSRRFMEMEALPLPTHLETLQENSYRKGHSLVLIAVGEQVVGAIELSPNIRPEAKATVEALQAQGLAIYIISGDHEAPTQHLAHVLGITRYYAGVLPKDKAILVEALKAEGRTVCFVGDGINDAIALSKADVAVSLRGATTIATDAAHIVLMSQNLSHLLLIRKIALNFNNTLNTLFRLTLLPLGFVIGTTFILHTGIYFSILVRNIGIAWGVGVALLPLRKYSQDSAKN